MKRLFLILVIISFSRIGYSQMFLDLTKAEVVKRVYQIEHVYPTEKKLENSKGTTVLTWNTKTDCSNMLFYPPGSMYSNMLLIMPTTKESVKYLKLMLDKTFIASLDEEGVWYKTTKYLIIKAELTDTKSLPVFYVNIINKIKREDR